MRTPFPERLAATRALLPLTAAIALALPVLWFADGRGAFGGGGGDALATGRVAAGDAGATGDREREPVVTSVPRRAAGRDGAEAGARRSPLPVAAEAARGAAPEAGADLGIVLHGHIECALGGLAGAVLIRAEGPGGQALEELGAVGAPYALHGLTPGDWTLVLRGPSILEHRRTVRIEADVEQLELDLAVEPMPSVEVLFVTSWGERLESALLQADRDPAGMPRLEVLGAELDSPAPELVPPTGAGRFRLADLGPRDGTPAAQRSLGPVSGWIELFTPPPFEVRVLQAGAELERRRVERLDEPLIFVVDPLEETGRPGLTGLLVDAETGDPVGDAIVELFAAGGEAPVRTRRVGADGRLRMAGIGGGDWVLSVWSAGRAHLLRPVRIDGAADYALGPIALSPARLLFGRLVGPDGRPLANRSLRWSSGRPGERVSLGYGREPVRTDAGGMFAVGGVPDGPVVLIAGGDEYAARTFELELDGARSGEVRIELAAGVPVGVAIDGPPDARFDLTIRDEAGRTVFLRPASVGRALRPVLAPGAYVALLHDGAREVARAEFRVDDESLGIVLRAGGR